MSAVGGIVALWSPGERHPDAREDQHGPDLAAAWARSQHVASTSTDLGPISPELALVDPELAEAARARLPERPSPAEATAPPPSPPPEVAPEERPRDRLEPVADDRRGPRSWLRTIVVVGVVTVAGTSAMLARSGRATDDEAVTSVTARPPAPATPTTPLSSPPTGETFVWAPTPDTRSYEFQLFRGAERIFRARVSEPRLVLPQRWVHEGYSESLTPGSYRWYVWRNPTTSRGTSAAIVQARLVVEAETP